MEIDKRTPPPDTVAKAQKPHCIGIHQINVRMFYFNKQLFYRLQDHILDPDKRGEIEGRFSELINLFEACARRCQHYN